MLILFIICMIAYLIMGYFYVKYAMPDIDSTSGEVLGALMAIWPILLLGIIVKVFLKRIGLYHPIFEKYFTIIISIIVVAIILYHYATIFK